LVLLQGSSELAAFVAGIVLLSSGFSETTRSIRQAAERPPADRMYQPVRHG
jgi:hypothetical protein